MTDNAQTDHWKHLAEILGADASESGSPPPQKQESITALPPAAVPAPAPRKPAKPASVPPVKHWGWLAGELGLEPAPEAEEPRAVAPAAEPIRAEHIPAEKITPAAAAAESPIPTEDVAFGLPLESVGLETTPQIVRPDVSRADRGSEDPLALESADFVEEVASAIEFEPSEEGEQSEAGDEGGEPRRRRRRRRGRRRRREDTAESAASESELEPDDAERDRDEAEEATAGEPVESEAREGDEGEELGRSRRRRRRRRGPREGQEGSQPDREAAGEEPESREREEEDEVEEEVEVEEEEDLDSFEEGGEDSSGEPRPKHRKIPCWTEAIEHIISLNMAARARNPGGGSRGRHRK